MRHGACSKTHATAAGWSDVGSSRFEVATTSVPRTSSVNSIVGIGEPSRHRLRSWDQRALPACELYGRVVPPARVEGTSG